MPPLLLQPLVENAVHHGIEPSSTGGNIVISTKRESRKVVVLISNSLPDQALAASAGQGMALNNVRGRLSLLHDIESSFQAGVKDGHYVVRMELPL